LFPFSAGGISQRPIETPKRRRIARRKPCGNPSAWEESGRNPRPGCWRNTLEGANPKGASSRRRVNSVFDDEGFPQGSKPGNRTPRPPVRRLRWKQGAGQTVRGSVGAVTLGHLAGGKSFEGEIPKAPPVRNRTGKAAKGANRREGGQTLRAEHSGQATPARSGPSRLTSAIGKQSSREEPATASAVDRLGLAGRCSTRRR
jgi:hypothetical protein